MSRIDGDGERRVGDVSPREIRRATAAYFLTALACFYGFGLHGVYAVSLLVGLFSAQA